MRTNTSVNVNQLITVLQTIEEFLLYKRKSMVEENKNLHEHITFFLTNNRNLCNCISQYGSHMGL